MGNLCIKRPSDEQSKIRSNIYSALLSGDIVRFRNAVGECQKEYLLDIFDLQSVCRLIREGDGIIVTEMLQSPFADVFALDLITRGNDPYQEYDCTWIYHIKSNDILFSQIINRLKKCVTHKHKVQLEALLKSAVHKCLPLNYLNMVDELVAMIMKNRKTEDTSGVDFVRNIYKDLFIESEVDHFNVTALIMHVLRIGIFRHIDILFNKYSATFKTLIINDIEAQLYIKRYIFKACNPNKDIVTIMSNNDINQLREWYSNVAFTSSRIIKVDNYPSADQSTNKIIDNLLFKMDSLQTSNEAEEVLKEVTNMMIGISENIYQRDQPAKCIKPILVGSKNEETQCFYPNEFDFFLFDPEGELTLNTIHDTLKAAVAAYRCMTTNISKLTIDSFAVQLDKNYPCVHCSWRGFEYLDMPITIDVVPTGKLNYSNANDVMRFKNNSYLDQYYDIYTLLYCDGNLQYVSRVENVIIRSISTCFRHAYRLAKAVRVSCLLRPLFQKLIALGMTDDIHNIISYYTIKVCMIICTI